MFRTMEIFLVNKIFCLGLVRQEKPPGRPESHQARPGPHLKAAAKAGRLGTLTKDGRFSTSCARKLSALLVVCFRQFISPTA
jgi:hypothetical protein